VGEQVGGGGVDSKLEEGTFSTDHLVSFRTPATHGGLLAPELSTGGARAESPVLGPGALGVMGLTQP
jgi:hypothetical protein